MTTLLKPKYTKTKMSDILQKVRMLHILTLLAFAP